MDFDPVYSETSVEALYHRALKSQLTPANQHKLKELGIDLAAPLLPAYPQELWERALVVVVPSLFPGVPPEKAFRQVGQLYIRGFAETLLGKAVVQMGKLIGPERTLRRMQRNQRTTSNYTTLEIEKLSPIHYRLHAGVEAAYLPKLVSVPGFDLSAFLAGIYDSVLLLLELRNPQVTYQDVDPATFRTDFDLTWTA